MRVYVEAYGCSQNQGEAARMTRALKAAGHPVVSRPEEGEVGLLVTCAVIGPTEERMVSRWRGFRQRFAHTIVTGCMVPLRVDRMVPETEGSGETHFLPISEQDRVADLVTGLQREHAFPEEMPIPGEREGDEPKDRPVHREVVIAQGCTSQCSYCFSRLARGRLASRPPSEIVREVIEGVNEGIREVRLSSLDTSCYGLDRDQNGGRILLPELVDRVCSQPDLPDFRVRVGMMSPQSLRRIARPYFQRLAEEDRLFKFLHLPVQSGSDEVLVRMRRGYTVEQFLNLVDQGRKLCPEVTVSTDVIVGFPAETETDHRRTLSLLEEVNPEIVNVTRFSPRPGTPAAAMARLPGAVVKERSRQVAALRMRLARRKLEAQVGGTASGLACERGIPDSTVYRLQNYLPVIVQGLQPLGRWASLRIVGARSHYLLGKLAERGADS